MCFSFPNTMENKLHLFLMFRWVRVDVGRMSYLIPIAVGVIACPFLGINPVKLLAGLGLVGLWFLVF